METQGRPTGVTQAADRGPLREEAGAQGGACRHLPCTRAPSLLKKVLPGQRGGPDVLKRKRKRREHELSALTRGRHRHVLPSGFKHLPNYALFIPSENASLKSVRLIV